MFSILNQEILNNLNKKIDNKDEIITELKDIKKTLDFIKEEITEIKDTINNDLKYSSGKINNHIDFIEKIYENVKNPLGYLCKVITFNTNENDHKYLDFDSDNKNDSDDSDDSDESENESEYDNEL
tara:strand:+ start:238 stop:615 length:378 start_codon:yes stop_codon:yes gene_type:complete